MKCKACYTDTIGSGSRSGINNVSNPYVYWQQTPAAWFSLLASQLSNQGQFITTALGTNEQKVLLVLVYVLFLFILQHSRPNSKHICVRRTARGFDQQTSHFCTLRIWVLCPCIAAVPQVNQLLQHVSCSFATDMMHKFVYWREGVYAGNRQLNVRCTYCAPACLSAALSSRRYLAASLLKLLNTMTVSRVSLGCNINCCLQHLTTTRL